MHEFEISIKSAPHGAVVTVQGSTPAIIVQFGILANSISERCGIPRELLMMAVMKGAEMERDLIRQRLRRQGRDRPRAAAKSKSTIYCIPQISRKIKRKDVTRFDKIPHPGAARGARSKPVRTGPPARRDQDGGQPVGERCGHADGGQAADHRRAAGV